MELLSLAQLPQLQPPPSALSNLPSAPLHPGAEASSARRFHHSPSSEQTDLPGVSAACRAKAASSSSNPYPAGNGADCCHW